MRYRGSTRLNAPPRHYLHYRRIWPVLDKKKGEGQTPFPTPKTHHKSITPVYCSACVTRISDTIAVAIPGSSAPLL